MSSQDRKRELLARLATVDDSSLAEMLARELWIINQHQTMELFLSGHMVMDTVLSWPLGDKVREEAYLHRKEYGGSCSISELVDDFLWSFMRADAFEPSVGSADFRRKLIDLCCSAVALEGGQK